jgi:hypothetical protein
MAANALNTTPTSAPIEKYYTINDLAELLSMSFERVRQLVMNEPGVLVIPPSTPRSFAARRGTSSRTRNIYRIPASVAQRILRRCANPAAA